MMSFRLLFVTLPLILLAACGSNDTADDPGSTTPPADGDYVATGLSDPFTGTDEVALTVKDGGVSVRANCNTMMGTATWADGTLTTSGLASTQMGCPDAAAAQDAWLLALLEGKPGYTIDGDTFTLTGDSGSLTFQPRSAVHPDLALEGTGWTLSSIGTGGADGAVSSVPMGAESTLFIWNGKLRVHPGCNTGRAKVEITDTTLTFPGIALTKMACEGDAADLEKQVLAVLDGTVDYAIDGNQLTLTAASGDFLVYTAAE